MRSRGYTFEKSQVCAPSTGAPDCEVFPRLRRLHRLLFHGRREVFEAVDRQDLLLFGCVAVGQDGVDLGLVGPRGEFVLLGLLLGGDLLC